MLPRLWLCSLGEATWVKWNSFRWLLACGISLYCYGSWHFSPVIFNTWQIINNGTNNNTSRTQRHMQWWHTMRFIRELTGLNQCWSSLFPPSKHQKTWRLSPEGSLSWRLSPEGSLLKALSWRLSPWRLSPWRLWREGSDVKALTCPALIAVCLFPVFPDEGRQKVSVWRFWSDLLEVQDFVDRSRTKDDVVTESHQTGGKPVQSHWLGGQTNHMSIIHLQQWTFSETYSYTLNVHD